ncbi:MAG: ABC transporter ATP-binding protein [Actinobacteria bacterium]|nr:ABC transporter ATP-binding protein [Actinomycetota bacterium]
MGEPAVRIEGVSKRYQLGALAGGSLSQRLESAVRHPLRRMRGTAESKPETSEFWALRDVDLGIEEGKITGLIGPNGAGKSTLLKLLCRITAPTEGRIELRGRVGSLLEVGTGFHPELTGRENIFLNGAILGMRREEIIRRFSEIVEFSGIGQFLDTPVKRYSSGMYVRLAFAIAAHLESEILLIDEVLAVGDQEFQRKCLGKMEEVSTSGGRTVIFVAHNMSSIRRLCDSAVLLDHGRVLAHGDTDRVVADYLERVEPVQHGGIANIAADAQRSGIGGARLLRVELSDSSGGASERVRYGEPLSLSLGFEIERRLPGAAVQVGVSTAEGINILTSHSSDRGSLELDLEEGMIELRCELRATLLPGEFAIDVDLLDARGFSVDRVERTLNFKVLNVAFDGSGDHYPWPHVRGSVRPESDWSVVQGAGSRVQAAERG